MMEIMKTCSRSSVYCPARAVFIFTQKKTSEERVESKLDAKEKSWKSERVRGEKAKKTSGKDERPWAMRRDEACDLRLFGSRAESIS
jgi:hypothetical protein